MTRHIKIALAIFVAAFAYVIASLLRGWLLGNLGAGFSGQPSRTSPFDALVVIAITMGSGVVARILFSEKVLFIGFLSGTLGEIARGLLFLWIALNKYPDLMSEEIPIEITLNILLNGIPSGILAAGGSAIATVIIGNQLRSAPMR